jgi:hypothetical protein
MKFLRYLTRKLSSAGTWSSRGGLFAGMVGVATRRKHIFVTPPMQPADSAPQRSDIKSERAYPLIALEGACGPLASL